MKNIVKDTIHANGIDIGNKTIVYVNGHKCLRFTYSRYKEYQDANGAIYDTVKKQWIG